MEIMGPLVFMHLKGSSYAMGVQHGALLAHLYPEDELLEMRAALDPLHAPVTGFAQLVQAFKQFYFQFKMAPWIRRNVPDDLGQEIDGILYGVSGGQDTDPMDIIMGNVYQDLGMAFGCTSVVAVGDAPASGSLYHARNLDNLSMMDWAPYGYVVVYEPDRGYSFLTHIYPIHAGTMQAMNNQGITVSMNYSLVDQADNSLDGIAMVFLMRQIVQYASTLDEAVQIVLGSPRTFGMNIVISDSKIPDAVVLEVDANRYSIRRAKDGFSSRPIDITPYTCSRSRLRAGCHRPGVKSALLNTSASILELFGLNPWWNSCGIAVSLEVRHTQAFWRGSTMLGPC